MTTPEHWIMSVRGLRWSAVVIIEVRSNSVSVQPANLQGNYEGRGGGQLSQRACSC